MYNGPRACLLQGDYREEWRISAKNVWFWESLTCWTDQSPIGCFWCIHLACSCCTSCSWCPRRCFLGSERRGSTRPLWSDCRWIALGSGAKISGLENYTFLRNLEGKLKISEYFSKIQAICFWRPYMDWALRFMSLSTLPVCKALKPAMPDLRFSHIIYRIGNLIRMYGLRKLIVKWSRKIGIFIRSSHKPLKKEKRGMQKMTI